MKTDIDIKDDIYRFVKDSALHSTISGNIYKTVRPNNSALEDIVISVLANNNRQLQEAYVYVNIYVQDVFNGTYYEEDSKRLRTLCALAFDILNVGNCSTFRFSLEEQRVLKSQGSNEHAITNKLLYRQYNN